MRKTKRYFRLCLMFVAVFILGDLCFSGFMTRAEAADKLGTVTIETVSYKGNQLTLSLKKLPKAKGYEVILSKDKKFKPKKTAKYGLGSKRKLSISQLGKGTYYIKARAYAYNSNGKVYYGKYGKARTVQVKNIIKEYAPTKSSANIIKKKVVSQSKVTITANVKNRVKSSDDFYYLVKVNGSNDSVANMIQKKTKSNKLTFELDTEDKANVICKFAVAVKTGGKYEIISKCFYLDNPEKAAENTSKYVLPASKKGMHYAELDSNLECKHTLINLNLNDVLRKRGSGTAYVYNGKTYYFDSVEERRVRSYNQKGISVTMVLYMNWSETNKYLITPSGRQAGHNWYALNTTEEKSRETLEAMFSYLGERFGQKDCYVSNWILGNEVNSQVSYNYAGNIDIFSYARIYAQAFEMLSSAVQSSYKNAKVFIPLDYAWAVHNSMVGWSGRNMLVAFDQELEKENPNTRWNLAYHPYSFPLTGASYASNPHLTDDEYSEYVGMKNIEVVTNYIKKTYGKDTRIILSEQGYTVGMGETAQAASMAYAYYKAEFNPMIDAFIVVRYQDIPAEQAMGLSMGLVNNNGSHRKVYDVFKYMDTAKSEKYTKKYLKTIGADSWKSIIPGFNSAKLMKMK